jgi:Asp/Glu/hydantoin racemase
MRIWHQSFTVLEDLPAYAERMRAHLKGIVRADTVVDLHGLMPGTFPANYPGDDMAFSPLFALHCAQWMLNARTAAADGYDGFAMCTLIDPLHREIKSFAGIPVVTAGEASYHMACMLGHRFGMLLFMDRLVTHYAEKIRLHGLSERYVGALPVGFGFQDVLRAFESPGHLIDQFRIAARKLIAAGADVIIPGELPLNLLLATEKVSRVDDVPIIDGFGLTLKMTEMMVDLKQSTGLAHSGHGWFNQAASPERFDQIANFYFRDEILSRFKR